MLTHNEAKLYAHLLVMHNVEDFYKEIKTQSDDYFHALINVIRKSKVLGLPLQEYLGNLTHEEMKMVDKAGEVSLKGNLPDTLHKMEPIAQNQFNLIQFRAMVEDYIPGTYTDFISNQSKIWPDIAKTADAESADDIV